MDHTIPYLREIIIFLAAAGILVPLFQKFKISPVLGFLISGIMLGPFGAGLLYEVWEPASAIVITGNDGVRALAELGVVFLMFMIGLELSFERLSALRKLVFGLGSLQVVTTALVIGAIAFAFGNGAEASVVLGLGFALSSTAIVMQLLAEQKQLGSPTGRTSFAILLFQDLSVVLILFILSFLGPQTDVGTDESLIIYVLRALGWAGVTIASIVVVGRLILRPLFRMVGASQNRELFMATTLFVIITIAAGTAAAGLSMALGAFLAGLLLAETEYRRDIELAIDPFKGLLIGLFFMSVGMDINLYRVLEHPLWIPASVIGLIGLKAIILYPMARFYGLSKGRSIRIGLLLGQAGEFAFIVIGMALTLKLLPRDIAQFMLIVTSLSMLITPLVARMAHKLQQRIDGPDISPFSPAYEAASVMENHVILAGFGRMGSLLGNVLAEQDIPTVAIEINPPGPFSGNIPIIKGSAFNQGLLKKAGIEKAKAVAVIIDKAEDAEKVIKSVRALSPHILIVARAHDAKHATELYQLGATATIPDIVEGSLYIAHALLMEIGVPEETVHEVIKQKRARELHMIETARSVDDTEISSN